MSEIPILTEDNIDEMSIIGGVHMSRGLVQRNYAAYPPGYLSIAPVFSEAMLLPENEWTSRLKDQQDAKASLYDIREANYDVLKSMNQDGLGLCWAFSTTKAVMYLRALMNATPVALSAWYVAGIINGWRDRGGWGAASLDFIAEKGVPELRFCPEYRRNYDTEETRNDAAKHRVTEWWDGTQSRDQNKRIMLTAFLLGLPPVLDYNHISHSMCGCRLVSVDPLVVDCDNSWGEGTGNKGLYRLEGSRAVPDGIVIPRVPMAN